MSDIWMDVDVNLSEVPVNIMPLISDSDFKTRQTGVVFNSPGMDLVWNFVTTAGAFTQTAVTPTSGGAYDWVHQGDGMYSIEIPASGGASINNDAEGFGWFTGLVTGVLPWRGPVIGFRAAAINDSLVDGPVVTADANVTQWDGANVASPDTAGYPVVTIKTGTGDGELDLSGGQVAVWSLATDVIDADAFSQDAVDELSTDVWLNSAGPVLHAGDLSAATANTVTLATPPTGDVDDQFAGNVFMLISSDGVLRESGICESYIESTGVLTAYDNFELAIDNTYAIVIYAFKSRAVGDVNVTQWNGAAVATPTVAGVPEVDVTHWLGTAAAATNPGIPNVNMVEWAGVNDPSFQAWFAVWGNNSGPSPRLYSAPVVSATANTLVFNPGLDTFVDDFFNGYTVVAISPDLIGEARVVSDYDEATNEITISENWSITPDNTYFVAFYPFGSSAVTGTVDANVIEWDGSAVATPSIAGVPEVDVTHWDGVAVASPTTPGVPEVAVNSEVIEGGLTRAELERLFLAALAGLSTGGGTPNVAFRDVADSKNRIEATLDVNGNRLTITLDGS